MCVKFCVCALVYVAWRKAWKEDRSEHLRCCCCCCCRRYWLRVVIALFIRFNVR